jgi:hypothetical protein
VRQDPVRDEAERLVAAAIAAVSMAARSIPNAGARAFATGSDECCVCPVCRVISSMRDPSAEMAERLASGAGDLASAVASVLRMLSRGGHGPSGETVDAEADVTREGDEFWESMRRKAADAARTAAAGVRGPTLEDDPWRQATVAPAPRPMAKKAVAKKVVAKKAVPPAGPEPAVAAKKAVAAKAAAPAKKGVAKKAVAKKAAKKAAPPVRGQEND